MHTERNEAWSQPRKKLPFQREWRGRYESFYSWETEAQGGLVTLPRDKARFRAQGSNETDLLEPWETPTARPCPLAAGRPLSGGVSSRRDASHTRELVWHNQAGSVRNTHGCFFLSPLNNFLLQRIKFLSGDTHFLSGWGTPSQWKPPKSNEEKSF